MRPLSLAFLLTFLVSMQSANAVEQKTILVVNDTPYSIMEFSMWPEPAAPSLETIPYRGFPNDTGMIMGSLDPLNTVHVYVNKDHCLFIFAALTDFGLLFNGEVDTCDPRIKGLLLSSMFQA